MSRSSNLAGVRVLLVEDSEINQHVATHYLSALGAIVTTAANGLQALTVLKQAPFDVVLMDCEMPVMDGFTTTRHIRQREQSTSHLPVIALTANAMNEYVDRCRYAGMDSHIAKPFDMHGLLAAIGPFVNRPSAIDEDLLEGLVSSGLLMRLIATFESQLDNRLEAIANATTSEELRLAAHALRSPSATLGFKLLAEECRKIEEGLAPPSISDLEVLAYDAITASQSLT